MTGRWRAADDPAWTVSVHPDLDAYPLAADEWRVYARVCAVVGRDRYHRRLDRLADARYRESAAEAARACRLSERRVRQVRELLVVAGMIDEVEQRPGTTTVYRVRPRSDWVPAERLPSLRAGRTAARGAAHPGTSCSPPRHDVPRTPAPAAGHTVCSSGSTHPPSPATAAEAEAEVDEALGVLRRRVGAEHAHRVDAERDRLVDQLGDVQRAVAESVDGGDPPGVVDVARALTARGWDGCRDPVAAVLGRRRRAEAVAALAEQRSRAGAADTDEGCPVAHLHGEVVDADGRPQPCDRCGATDEEAPR